MIKFNRRDSVGSKVRDLSEYKAIASLASVGEDKKRNSRKNLLVSESASNMMGTPLNNTSVSTLPITVDLGLLLDDIGNDLFSLTNDKTLYRIYRDMYYHDPVSGSAVDMQSSLPFSDFSLGGIQDKKVSEKYMRVIERLNVRTLLPEISTDYMVLGAFIGSLLFDKTSKNFSDIMPHAIESVTITPLPFYSQAPILEVSFPEQLIKLLTSSKSPRIQALKDKFGEEVLAKIQQGRLELDPLSTVYLPRRTFSFGEGTSYYKRVLPIWLLEKNLFRGTLLESARRQRGIAHLTVGDGDSWEPTSEDLDFVSELFTNASADPLGAIVATRLGVSVDEVLNPESTWKWTDIIDQCTSMKYKAFGINESLISGEATLNTMDNSLTMFIDHLRSYRDMITRKFFYNTLFPLVSVIHGYTSFGDNKLRVGESLLHKNLEDTLSVLQDGSRLFIPTIHWAKQLKPEGDSAYFDILDKMTALGIPIPLRIVAAAGGFNIHDLLSQQDDDIATRIKLGDYNKRLAELTAKYAPANAQGNSEDDSYGGFSSSANSDLLKALASDSLLSNASKSSVLAKAGSRPSLVERFEDSDSEVKGRTRTGKVKAIFNQKKVQDDANMNIIKALKNHKKRGRSQLTAMTTTHLT